MQRWSFDRKSDCIISIKQVDRVLHGPHFTMFVAFQCLYVLVLNAKYMQDEEERSQLSDAVLLGKGFGNINPCLRSNQRGNFQT